MNCFLTLHFEGDDVAVAWVGHLVIVTLIVRLILELVRRYTFEIAVGSETGP